MADLYPDVAFLCVVLICDSCSEMLSSEQLDGAPVVPADGWDIALGNAARERGWIISEHGQEFSIVCPSCAER